MKVELNFVNAVLLHKLLSSKLKVKKNFSTAYTSTSSLCHFCLKILRFPTPSWIVHNFVKLNLSLFTLVASTSYGHVC
jgi:hypothetical protein